MGAAAGIDTGQLDEVDYETLKASSIGFGAAHNVLERSLTAKAKSLGPASKSDITTIHHLAIRQLSNNLRNQEKLSKTRKKILKVTKSLTENSHVTTNDFLLAPENSWEGSAAGWDVGDPDDDTLAMEAALGLRGGNFDASEGNFSHEDLALVHDDEYHSEGTPAASPMQTGAAAAAAAVSSAKSTGSSGGGGGGSGTDPRRQHQAKEEPLPLVAESKLLSPRLSSAAKAATSAGAGAGAGAGTMLSPRDQAKSPVTMTPRGAKAGGAEEKHMLVSASTPVLALSTSASASASASSHSPVPTQSPVPVPAPAPAPAPAPRKGKPRPVLSLQLSIHGEVSSSSLAADTGAGAAGGAAKRSGPQKGGMQRQASHGGGGSEGGGASLSLMSTATTINNGVPHAGMGAGVGVVAGAGSGHMHPPSPSADMRVSPRGTLYMGKWKVMETGIFPDESHGHGHGHRGASRRSGEGSGSSHENLAPLNHSHSQHGHSSHGHSSHGNSSHGHDQHGALSSSYSLRKLQHQHRANGQGGTASSSNSMHGSFGPSSSLVRKHTAVPLPAIGGKGDFLEINTLGSGASGVVTEAIHLPSLTIVALKMLPVYNQEKRQHVSRELGVLYKNLAELRLVDDSLYPDPDEPSKPGAAAASTAATATAGLGGSSSPHILSLYNAFVDPKSGMINLVIEYMDGGSLEDLVQQGGCRDEKVLADIAYQTIKGLCFLHNNKSVHRDIKPANILCSTSGLIKIGDFGISKALDKTSGFANSFVGTVSYMSP
jgi:hypothetical protein